MYKNISERAAALVRELRVPTLVILFCTLFEVFLRSDYFWSLPYKNSRNYTHEGLKLNKLRRMSRVPDVLILGSSWGEFGLDSNILARESGLKVFNMSVISTRLIEHIALYYFVKRFFGKAPRYTLLVLDFTHIPIKHSFPTLKVVSKDIIATLINDSLKGHLNNLLLDDLYVYKYRNDIKTSLNGFITGHKDYILPKVSIREEHLRVWKKEKRWESLRSLEETSVFNKQFREKEIL